jgi:hypothetical protein
MVGHFILGHISKKLKDTKLQNKYGTWSAVWLYKYATLLNAKSGSDFNSVSECLI